MVIIIAISCTNNAVRIFGWEQYHNKRLEYSNMVGIYSNTKNNNCQWKQVIYLHFLSRCIWRIIWCCKLQMLYRNFIFVHHNFPTVLWSIYFTSGICIPLNSKVLKLLKLLFLRSCIWFVHRVAVLAVLLVRSFLTLSHWWIFNKKQLNFDPFSPLFTFVTW